MQFQNVVQRVKGRERAIEVIGRLELPQICHDERGRRQVPLRLRNEFGRCVNARHPVRSRHEFTGHVPAPAANIQYTRPWFEH